MNDSTTSNQSAELSQFNQSEQEPRRRRRVWLFVVIIAALWMMSMVGVAVTLYATRGKGAAEMCNGFGTEVAPTIQPLLSGKYIDGKEYQCNKWVGDPPHRQTAIHYTVRGTYDATQTTATLTQQISQRLQSGGWLAQAVTDHDSQYKYVLASDRHVGATFTVVSPKYNLFTLNVRTLTGYQARRDSQKMAPQSIVPPSDELAKYASFTVLTPTVVPTGFQPWQKGAYTVSDEGGVGVTFVLGGNPNAGQTSIFEELFEPGDTLDANCSSAACPLKQVGTTKQGKAIYGLNPSPSTPEQYQSFVTVIGDTKVTFSWPPGRSAADPTNAVAVQVLNSLH